MSSKEMKALLASLAAEAAKAIDRPAEPDVVMHAFCQAMSVRVGRPIQLLFRTFPDDIAVSGMRLDCGDRSVIVVEERAVPESKLVILGHELWHEEKGGCGHHMAGIAAAARSVGLPQTPEALQRAAELVLTTDEVPREALLTVAARADSEDDHEVDAETFGLLFGREARTWIPGPYAQGPYSAATVEGRINLSLTSRSRLI